MVLRTLMESKGGNICYPLSINTRRNTAMTPPIQRTVIFYDDELIALQEPDTSAIYVPLARLCENLGIARARQAQRVREHAVLSRGLRTLTFVSKGGPQQAECLRLDMIPLWLAGVNANRVKDTVKEKLVLYQSEVAGVLWDAFRHEILPPTPAAIMPMERSSAEIAYEMATAIQHLAKQQMEMEQRLGGRMDAMARWATQVERRMSNLELQINPEETITEAQANEIALAVKTVAAALEASGTKNGYQRVYAELYRRERIGAYRKLAQGRYQAVLDWLHQWHQELTRESAST